MSSEAAYVFTRDYLDNNRINLQHYQWKELFGYLTHPDIPLGDPALSIADIGTGTGIWLTELARHLPPSVRLDGLDVSFHATPPPQWLPSNVTLRHWDCRSDMLEELVGLYDVVHIRNFSFVLQKGDIQHVLDNLMGLIRPGGYLQWAEPYVASFRIEKTHPENEVYALQQLRRISQAQDTRLNPEWVPSLPTLFTASGFGNVRSDIRNAPPHLALAMHECNLPIHELIARKTGNESVSQGLASLMPEIVRETREGSCWAFTRWIVVGRKPPKSIAYPCPIDLNSVDAG